MNSTRPVAVSIQATSPVSIVPAAGSAAGTCSAEATTTAKPTAASTSSTTRFSVTVVPLRGAGRPAPLSRETDPEGK